MDGKTMDGKAMDGRAQADAFIPRRERGLDSFTRSMRRGLRRGRGNPTLLGCGRGRAVYLRGELFTLGDGISRKVKIRRGCYETS